ncbi:DNA alkylation repair protein [Mesobacillus zeae]|uniref:DNA alkylation repair protein n=1 Tax=Mesobacillus zeae TaxID=1917180 RepID=A0A398B6E7_9BACI|nr:DNA alkylation repair protein [Mesobacillus zeae]RID85515.1 DNA alkylation repair protein [Mesobacillus zeae]
MNVPYRCPNCRTNRSRFNLIRQVPQAVKLDPGTGAIMEEYTADQPSPFQIPYKGPELKIQCGVCGLIEDELTFAKFGEQA